MKQEVSAGIITYTYTINNAPLYLILEHQDGHWDLPKGKIEAGETLEQTAARELLEETGLTAQLDEKFRQSIHYIFSNKENESIAKTVTFFLGKAASNEVKLSHEHSNYKWLSLNDALKVVSYENARQLLELADYSLQKHN